MAGVPVRIAAQVYGKNEQWVRAGICNGWLNIGYATKGGKRVTSFDQQESKHRINYYISPKKLYEDTGYLYEED